LFDHAHCITKSSAYFVTPLHDDCADLNPQWSAIDPTAPIYCVGMAWRDQEGASGFGEWVAPVALKFPQDPWESAHKKLHFEIRGLSERIDGLRAAIQQRRIEAMAAS
jgi:hypothetical protein